MKSRMLTAALLLLGAIVFNLVLLWPEVAVDTPWRNDNAMHVALVQRVVEALDRGEDPTDPWVPYFDLGYPLFRHYQHLPHLATGLLYKALAGALPVETLFRWVSYLLLSTFPLSLYWTGRRLGFGPLPAALTGVVASLLATSGLYGLDMSSYVWQGHGLFTQLWGMWLLGPAVACLHSTVSEGRGYAGTAALVAATLLSHTVLGYTVLVSGLLFAVLGGGGAIGRRLGRLLLVFLLVALVAAYFLVPFVRDRLYMNRSELADPATYDGYGWEWTLEKLVTGQLLDYGRFPGLTILAGLGLVVCGLRWRDERYRLPLAFFLFWLLLYFGRPTWGVLLNLLPMSQDLQLHRLIAPVHLGALALVGAGLGWLWERVLAFRQRWPVAVAALVTVGLLVPVCVDRTAYLLENGRLQQQNAAAVDKDAGKLAALLADLGSRPPGRVYAGLAGSWGDTYRIGAVPVYALLAQSGFAGPGARWHALSLPADLQADLDEGRPALFDLFNLRYAIIPGSRPPPGFAELVATYGSHRLFQVDTTGYFDLVDSELALAGPRSDWLAAMRAWMQSAWVEARQHPAIFLDGAPGDDVAALPLREAAALFAGPPPQRAPCGRLGAEQVAGNSFAVEVEAERACWLLLKQTYHPGWQAAVDGQPVSTQMLAPGFVGLRIEEGRHDVELRFGSEALRLWLAAAGGLVLLAAAVIAWQGECCLRGLARLLAPLAARLRWLESTWLRLVGAVAVRWNRDWIWIAGVVAMALLAALPTLQLRQMGGHEALQYLPRAVEFYRNLAEGQLIPRWAPDLSQGYGQPIFLFDPPLVYYAAAAFHALGISMVISLDLVALALLVLAGLGMYFYVREFFGRAGGLVAGVAYVLGPFVLLNLYVRFSLGDLAALAWVPWALWGLWGWVYVPVARPPAELWRARGHLVLAGGAVVLLVLSSNAVALVVLPMLGAYVLFLARRVRSWAAVGRGAWAVFLGLGLGAYYWLPALVERSSVRLGRLLEGCLSYRDHFVYLHQLLYSPWGYGLSQPGTDDGMSFGLGLAQLLLLGASLVVARVLRAQLRDAGEGWFHFWFFIGVLGAAVFLATENSLLLWDHLPLLSALEYPWTMLALAAVATAFICGFPFLAARDHPRQRWLLLLVLGGLFLTGIIHAQPQGYQDLTDADYAPAAIAAQAIESEAARRHEPSWVHVPPPSPPLPERLEAVSGTVRIVESRIGGTRYEWTLQAAGPARMRVGTFYYPGWQLTVDGSPRLLVQSPPSGLMEFDLEEGTHTVRVEFGTTPLRTWAVVLSGAALLVLVGTLVWTRARRRPR